MSAATEGKPAVKPLNSEAFGSGLAPSESTRFEAERLQQDPFSHGYKAQKHNNRLTPRISHAIEPQGPGEFIFKTNDRLEYTYLNMAHRIRLPYCQMAVGVWGLQRTHLLVLFVPLLLRQSCDRHGAFKTSHRQYPEGVWNPVGTDCLA